MKIKDIKENYTSATSVGNIEYTTHSKAIRLKRRKQDDEEPETVAWIKREANDGWRFKPTSKWKEHDLPHLGHIFNKKLKRRGEKTLDKNIEKTLKELGIAYDSIEKEADE